MPGTLQNDIMTLIRGMFYLVGIASGLAVAGRMFAAQSRHGNALGATMVGWAVVSLVRFVLLLHSAFTGDCGLFWASAVQAIVSPVYALPLVVYVYFRNGSR